MCGFNLIETGQIMICDCSVQLFVSVKQVTFMSNAVFFVNRKKLSEKAVLESHSQFLVKAGYNRSHHSFHHISFHFANNLLLYCSQNNIKYWINIISIASSIQHSITVIETIIFTIANPYFTSFTRSINPPYCVSLSIQLIFL